MKTRWMVQYRPRPPLFAPKADGRTPPISRKLLATPFDAFCNMRLAWLERGMFNFRVE